MKTAIIAGAGPAGLTAAYELQTRAGFRPVVLEKTDCVGGISRTVNYKGNRIDIGGHRFFSKSDRVMDWWLGILPLEGAGEEQFEIAYQGRSRTVARPVRRADPGQEDLVMLVRSRLSRIYFLRQFFRYPISLSLDTLRKLGLARSLRIGLSYLRASLFPIRDEKSLEDFLINRFGRELYRTFFKSYTEKVWGVPCTQISAEWGAQRIKGLSVYRAILHHVKSLFGTDNGLSQKKTETSLIERFLYPKFGPGQMWEEVARRVSAAGGEVLMGWDVRRIEQEEGRRIVAIHAVHAGTGEVRRFEGDVFFSTMPVKELVAAMEPSAPAPIREISGGLMYRDFITVGLLCRRLRTGALKDNWIYIQEPEVLVGRLQIFNNWSPYMVADPSTTWVGLEFFCNESEALWQMPDAELVRLAKEEMSTIGLLDLDDVLDATVIRMPKTYPAYFGSYDRFSEIIRWADAFDNLFLIGRNGMHKYNNQDHSMLTAMTAVDNMLAGIRSRDNLWALNTEQEYQEEK